MGYTPLYWGTYLTLPIMISRRRLGTWGTYLGYTVPQAVTSCDAH